MKYFFYHCIITVKPVSKVIAFPGTKQPPQGAVISATYTGVWRAIDGLLDMEKVRRTVKVPENTILVGLTLVNFFEISEEQAKALEVAC